MTISPKSAPEVLPLNFADLLAMDAMPKESKHERYRSNNDHYTEMERKRGSTRDFDSYNEARRETNRNRPFIGWDTEGTNTTATPFLFGSSRGDRIAHHFITSWEMFDLVLAREELEPDAIHIIYGGEYDFNMMLRNLEPKQLWVLKTFNKVKWEDYEIEHIPRKWLRIKRGNVSARIFDVVTFFGVAYVKALQEHNIGTEEQLALVIEGKAGRSSFTYDDIDFIEPYWRTELELLP